jgi:hypothetical protein
VNPIDKKLYRDVLQDILDTIDPDYYLEEHILNRIKSTDEEQKESLNSTLRQMETKITDTISNSWHKIFPGKKKLEIIARPGDEESPQILGSKNTFYKLKLNMVLTNMKFLKEVLASDGFLHT